MIPSLTHVCTLYPQRRESDTVCTRIVDPHRVVHQLQSVCVKSERNLHCPLWTGVHLLGESRFPKVPMKKNVSWLVYSMRMHVFGFVLPFLYVITFFILPIFLCMLMDICISLGNFCPPDGVLGVFFSNHVSISMIPLCAQSKVPVNESRWSCITVICCGHIGALQVFNDMNRCSQL